MTLHWKFKNNRVWQQTFTNENEMYAFMYITSLTLHPDVASVWSVDGDKTTKIL